MADDDAIYKTAASSLFGEGFCKKAKGRDDELKCLNQAIPASRQSSASSREKTFFSRGPVQQELLPLWNRPTLQGKRKGLPKEPPLQWRVQQQPNVLDKKARPEKPLQ